MSFHFFSMYSCAQYSLCNFLHISRKSGTLAYFGLPAKPTKEELNSFEGFILKESIYGKNVQFLNCLVQNRRIIVFRRVKLI